MYNLTNRYFWKIRINIIGSLLIIRKENRYIVVIIDYFFRWSEVKTIRITNAKIVATFIYKEIIYRFESLRVL